jgi:hypothetical protein
MFRLKDQVGNNFRFLKPIIVVAATHITWYQNDAGGIKASSRWLSEATPPVMKWG